MLIKFFCVVLSLSTISSETHANLDIAGSKNFLRSGLLQQISRTAHPIDSHQYDEHFNCLENCVNQANIPLGCLEKSNKNQIQLLRVNNSELSPFYAYCNYDLDTNWLLIQRRHDGSENFYRGWQDYRNGFGNLYGEFWLGLERLHQITSNHKQRLWIRLIDYDDKKTDAFYNHFSIGDEAGNYQLNVFEYSGDAGNQLLYNNDAMFSTYDNHNGDGKENCAIREIGAWWYGSCAGSNLNGPYRSNANKKTKPSVSWTSGFKYESFRYVHMAIRPIEYEITD